MKLPRSVMLPFCLAALLVATIGAAGNDVRLMNEVKQGHHEAVRALLKQRVDPNAREADGTTALHWAVQADDRRMVDVLIAAGARVTTANEYSVTPIALAATNGNADIIASLLNAGADPNSSMLEGETVLMTAARTGNPDAVRMLAERGASVDATDGWQGQTPLMWAAAENHAAAVRVLIEHGAHINVLSKVWDVPRRRTIFTTFSKGGFSALMFAARQGALEAAATLIAAGADVNLADPDGITPLIEAIVNGHHDLAALLVDRGADVGLADKAGRTALYAAVDIHAPEWVPNRPPPRSTDRLDSLDIVKLLLDRGADPDVRLKAVAPNRKADAYADPILLEGATPFVRAAKTADVAAARALLSHGADPNLTNKNGANAIMAAAGLLWRDASSKGTETDAIEIIKMCLDRGADINAVTNDTGDTALHGAAARGANRVVQFLAARGAALNVKNRRGLTPLDEATLGLDDSSSDRRPPRPSTVALLRQLMARSDPIEGRTKTAIAVASGSSGAGDVGQRRITK